MPTALDTDTLLGLLANWRRRHLLYALQSKRCLTVETLLSDVYGADQVEDTRSSADGEQPKREQRISLLHNHLPRLADKEIIEYDPRNQDVVRGSRFDSVEPLLDTMRAYDTEIGAQARDSESDTPSTYPIERHDR
ncbi:hypothetical protein OB919_02320 [Halobacteria archaeon AArc-curdl1]|uniref:DUF7344 domain-containing protein n=1 Tax=Natronosalvus hydrolyticus TaxID=2979988 RepID=A0AAP2Z652_9EURY|nr:hypothetical protein [Halobacteria archaeon AArc-curdl1]